MRSYRVYCPAYDEYCPYYQDGECGIEDPLDECDEFMESHIPNYITTEKRTAYE